MTREDFLELDRAIALEHPNLKPYRPQKRGYVYFIQDGQGGDIKIGWSVDPDRRLRDLRVAHANRSKLRLLAAIPGRRELEREIHERFAPCRGEGEWFFPRPRASGVSQVSGAKEVTALHSWGRRRRADSNRCLSAERVVHVRAARPARSVTGPRRRGRARGPAPVSAGGAS